jgi:hypothetical protein
MRVLWRLLNYNFFPQKQQSGCRVMPYISKAVFESRFIPLFGETNLISVIDLKVGMFVSELDKPWHESSFQLQGFKITSDEAIKALQSQCQFVYIKAD